MVNFTRCAFTHQRMPSAVSRSIAEKNIFLNNTVEDGLNQICCSVLWSIELKNKSRRIKLSECIKVLYEDKDVVWIFLWE